MHSIRYLIPGFMKIGPVVLCNLADRHRHRQTNKPHPKHNLHGGGNKSES